MIATKGVRSSLQLHRLENPDDFFSKAITVIPNFHDHEQDLTGLTHKRHRKRKAQHHRHQSSNLVLHHTLKLQATRFLIILTSRPHITHLAIPVLITDRPPPLDLAHLRPAPLDLVATRLRAPQALLTQLPAQ